MEIKYFLKKVIAFLLVVLIMLPTSNMSFAVELVNESTQPQEENGKNITLAETTVATIGKNEYTTLQAAINASVDSSTPIILQKDITEILTISKDVMIDLNEHIVDGNKQGSVISITAGNVTIKNGTITGGYVEDANGAGINASGGALTLEHVTVASNEATKGYGGGIYILGATAVSINNCIIENNVAAKRGGGLAVIETASSSSLTKPLTIKDTVVQNNSCDGGYGYGGGMYLSTGSGISLKNVQVIGNTCTRTDEYSVTCGGGICLTNTRNSSSYILDQVTFEKNEARCGAELYDGTAQDITVQVKNCTFKGSDYSDADFSVESAVAIGQSSYWSNDSQEYRTFSDCTISDYRGLTMAPMDLERTATLNGCRIIGNEASEYGAVYYYDYLRGTLTLQNSVISGNAATGGESAAQCGGLYITYGNLSQIESDGKYSAIYGNSTNGANQANDLYVTNSSSALIVSANKMNDSTNPEKSFENYIWKDLATGTRYENGFSGTANNVALTAVEEIIRDVAEINGSKYETLQEAVNTVGTDSTIKLIAGDDDQYGDTIDTTTVSVTKDVNFEMNGKSIGPANDTIFSVTSSGVLSFNGNGELLGKVVINEGVKANAVEQNGAKAYINSACDQLEVSLGKGKYITYGNDFSANKITVHLSDDVLAAVNNETQIEDVILFKAENMSKKSATLLDAITISGWTNRIYSLQMNSNGDVVLHKDTTPAVYVNGTTGDDSNNGMSSAAPVKTFEKAKEVAKKKKCHADLCDWCAFSERGRGNLVVG